MKFVGHHIKGNLLTTMEKNIAKIKTAAVPTTKKQLRSLLALNSCYWKFIVHYSDKANFLTDLTAAKHPDKLKWNETHKNEFEKIQGKLWKGSVLKIRLK